MFHTYKITRNDGSVFFFTTCDNLDADAVIHQMHLCHYDEYDIKSVEY